MAHPNPTVLQIERRTMWLSALSVILAFALQFAAAMVQHGQMLARLDAMAQRLDRIERWIDTHSAIKDPPEPAPAVR